MGTMSGKSPAMPGSHRRPVITRMTKDAHQASAAERSQNRSGRRAGALRLGVAAAASGALVGTVALAGPADASPSPTCAKIAPGFSCIMRDRIAAVERYLDDAPGSISIVLNDRATGAVWRNANAAVDYPAASTMKLAMMTDILLRAGVGSIDLTSTDRGQMYNALYTSNDNDATALWDKYEDRSFLGRIRAFGMASAYFTSKVPRWGFMYCSAEDLDNLMNYVLADTPDGIQDYLVYQLQHVSALDQQWGAWGAGPASQPGNKDGWEYSAGTWITNTVGFAGPDQRYTLAIMYNLERYGGHSDVGFDYGTNELTQIASLLFQGHYTARPTPLPFAVP
jgi:hypothetical protein